METKSILACHFEPERFLEFAEKCGQPEEVTKQFYLNHSCNLELFVHVGRLIFPEFVVVNELVFISEFVNPNNMGKNQTRLSTKDYQASFNRLNLADYFNSSVANSNVDIFNAALEVVKNGWEQSLSKLYPNHKFVIETSNAFNASDDEPCIWFYQL